MSIEKDESFSTKIVDGVNPGLKRLSRPLPFALIILIVSLAGVAGMIAAGFSQCGESQVFISQPGVALKYKWQEEDKQYRHLTCVNEVSFLTVQDNKVWRALCNAQTWGDSVGIEFCDGGRQITTDVRGLTECLAEMEESAHMFSVDLLINDCVPTTVIGAGLAYFGTFSLVLYFAISTIATKCGCTSEKPGLSVDNIEDVKKIAPGLQ